MTQNRLQQKRRDGGKILADGLAEHGVKMVFGVPGESYLPLLNGLCDTDIRFITCRQEGGAAMMADAYAKITGNPGICMVTRAPGATNASAGIHVAQQDSTPVILLVGQVSRSVMDREAFQEIDYRHMFAPLAKWVAQIERIERIPEYLSRAFHVATSGRPGPVVLSLPEDMLSEQSVVADCGRYQTPKAYPAPDNMDRLRDYLKKAQRPFVILGGGGWTLDAVNHIKIFIEKNNLPTGLAFRCQDLLDNDHPCYAGHVGIGIDPALAQRIEESDVLVVIGARLGEITTNGYELLTPPRLKQTLIHVYPNDSELNRVFKADLAVIAAMCSFSSAAAEMPPLREYPWRAYLEKARVGYEKWSDHACRHDEIQNNDRHGCQQGVQMRDIVQHMAETLPQDAILCNGAGNYAIWLHRFYKYRVYRSQLAPTCGSMGYGVPAAVAAKLAYPGRMVIAFAGDGCFLMHGQELATAAQYGAAILVIIADNGRYGTIRLHQERQYPGQVNGTELKNPDFAQLAKAHGFYAETVKKTENFGAALLRAQEKLQAGQGALLHLLTSREEIAPDVFLANISG